MMGKNTVIGTRTPGKYMEDDGKSGIQDPEEYIHPSVRIRYLYNGLGLDDADEWECAALTKNGYKLQKSAGPPQLEDPYPKGPIASTYETLSGKVSSVYGGHTVDTQSHESHTLVVHQMPFEADLHPLDQPQNNWVWTQGTGNGKLTLPEERIGMWERLFININHKMVERQNREAVKPTQSQKRTLRERIFDKYYVMKGAAGKRLSGIIGRLLGSSAKLKPLDHPQKYGYHDLVSWQRGDVTKARQRNTWESQETGAS
ncbi:uncharacterized protein ColSpa_06526 [Colletotrichum spaethianum]|uniref:Uncharacterized protein n=1 Tax=Colletotrichum spaethianum TaxID=700344 RepID=A0AA37LI13_9PEZI|nr:uncharacterized protein ColSpa_06526 [Colletotrichum spaethianum]GKT46345.1 hypothetical protein ColSpa_06526 [Colletotrichum spaethianum]